MDIININIGQEGTRIGNEIIKQMHSEHFSVSQQPRGRYSSFFGETNKQIYARSLFLDVNTSKINNGVSSKQIVYKPQNILTQPKSSRNLYGETFYQCSQEFIESIQDSIRKETQRSDSIGGFLFVSSLSSGTGSGLTGKVMTHVKQYNPTKITQSFRLLPQLQAYSHLLQIYNAAFAIHNQIQNGDMTLLFDNTAISKLLLHENNPSPSTQQIYQKIASIISDTTIPYRFAGRLNTSQKKIASNMNLFPRLHFFSFSQNKSKNNPLTSALNPQQFLINNYFQRSLNSEIYAIYAGIRSNFIQQMDINSTVKCEFDKNNIKFVDWIPDNVHISFHSPINGRQNVNVFVNSQHFSGTTKKIAELYTLSFRRKAFFHSYASLGIEQMQFTEMQSNLNDLNSQYQPPTYYDQSETANFDQIEDES